MNQLAPRTATRILTPAMVAMLCGSCAHTVALEHFAEGVVADLGSTPNGETRPTLAIIGFRNDADQRDALARALEDELATAAYFRERYTLVERNRITVALREVTRNISDPLRDFFDDRTAVAIGNFVHAHYVLTGSWRPWTDGNIRVVMRLLAVETATVVAATAVTIDAETIPQESSSEKRRRIANNESASAEEEDSTAWRAGFGLTTLLELDFRARLSDYLWLRWDSGILSLLNIALDAERNDAPGFVRLLTNTIGLEANFPLASRFVPIDLVLGAGWWGDLSAGGIAKHTEGDGSSYWDQPSRTGPGGWLRFEFNQRFHIGVQYGLSLADTCEEHCPAPMHLLFLQLAYLLSEEDRAPTVTRRLP